jgi:hypothetical protein
VDYISFEMLVLIVTFQVLLTMVVKKHQGNIPSGTPDWLYECIKHDSLARLPYRHIGIQEGCDLAEEDVAVP